MSDVAKAERDQVRRFAGVLAVAVVAAYWGSFGGIFVFDDFGSIVQNPTIRNLHAPGAVFSPPFDAGQTVGGRPLLNLSFALNYAAGGLNPWGYHLVNLAIHLGATLALFGIVRRTLAGRAVGQSGGPAFAGLRRGKPAVVAFGAALLWGVHPLQVESITYVVQRAESMMGALYLLTLYGFVRATESGERPTPNAQHPTPNGRCEKRWLVLSAIACALGMATKEVMASAPVIVLCYDRVFVSGSWMEGLRRRKGYYAALAASWLLLGGLIASTNNRGGSVGIGLINAGWWKYALTQPGAILHYLRLVVWPVPLIFDYGAEWVTKPWSVAPAAVAVMLLAVAAAVGTLGGRAWGFLLIFFCAILAPTSLIPGNRQTLSEHRMYLALAPLAAWVAWGMVHGLRRFRIGSLALPATLAVALAFGIATWRRQAVYLSEMALWADTVAKRPLNPGAHENLGKAFGIAGRLEEAKAESLRALELEPSLPAAHGNLGNVLLAQGAVADAIVQFEEAVRLSPRSAVARFNLGAGLVRAGRIDEGVARFREALDLDPDFAAAAAALRQLGAVRDAESLR